MSHGAGGGTDGWVYKGRVGVITGAASGIGRELARLLRGLGMRLALVDVDEEGLEETAQLAGGGPDLLAWVADVGDEARVGWVAGQVMGAMGTPHLLVNNAGRLGSVEKPVSAFEHDDWVELLGTNLFGAVNWVRALLPAMRGLNEPSSIVNVASGAGLLVSPGGRLGAYSASKHALVAYTESLDSELAAEGSKLHVMLVCPGAVRTKLNLVTRTSGRANSPSSDWAEPEDIAEQIVDGIRRRRFYVLTHESLRPRLELRFDRILASFDGARPAPVAE